MLESSWQFFVADPARACGRRAACLRYLCRVPQAIAERGALWRFEVSHALHSGRSVVQESLRGLFASSPAAQGKNTDRHCFPVAELLESRDAPLSLLPDILAAGAVMPPGEERDDHRPAFRRSLPRDDVREDSRLARALHDHKHDGGGGRNQDQRSERLRPSRPAPSLSEPLFGDPAVFTFSNLMAGPFDGGGGSFGRAGIESAAPPARSDGGGGGGDAVSAVPAPDNSGGRGGGPPGTGGSDADLLADTLNAQAASISTTLQREVTAASSSATPDPAAAVVASSSPLPTSGTDGASSNGQQAASGPDSGSYHNSFYIDDVTVTEGDDGVSNAVFTVILSEVLDHPALVDYETEGITATASVDFVPQRGTLRFEAGETSKTISVPIIADMTFESNESFRIVLSNPVGDEIGDGIGVGTIVDDDAPTSTGTMPTSQDPIPGAPSLAPGAGLATPPDQPFSTGDGPLDLAIGLLDNDGFQDIVALGFDGSLTIAFNNGDGTLREVRTTDLGIGPAHGMALGLFAGGDIFVDLAVQGSDSLYIFKNDGIGNFSLAQTLTPGAPGDLAPVTGGRVGLTTGLLAGDLIEDLVGVSPGTNEVLVYPGQATGLGAPLRFATGASEPIDVVIGNFVGD
ncbi:MAG: Calx-beta domain-containing protein, partial [Gemmataceae bacterium]